MRSGPWPTSIGYPVLVRPSYVLGGRGMEIIYNEEELRTYVATAVKVSKAHPVLIDKYLSHAIEIDVDVVADGTDVFIGGIMEHIEEAGVHSGDATMMLPPQTIPPERHGPASWISPRRWPWRLQIKGLMNLQLAVKDDEVYMIEANPRASRTVPFVSKAIGIPLAKMATKVMLGRTLKELGYVGVAEFQSRRREGLGVPVPQAAGRGLHPRPGDEVAPGRSWASTRTWTPPCTRRSSPPGMKLPIKGGVYITVGDADKHDRAAHRAAAARTWASASTPPRAPPPSCGTHGLPMHHRLQDQGQDGTRTRWA